MSVGIDGEDRSNGRGDPYYEKCGYAQSYPAVVVVAGVTCRRCRGLTHRQLRKVICEIHGENLVVSGGAVVFGVMLLASSVYFGSRVGGSGATEELLVGFEGAFTTLD